MQVFETLDDVRAAVGQHLGTTNWVPVTDDQVRQFTAATGGPGNDASETVPPYLVLALTNLFLPQIVEVRGASLGLNYGTGEVRFPTVAPIGARIRGRGDLVACDEIPGGIQTTMRITVEIEGHDQPACVVESLSRWLS